MTVPFAFANLSGNIALSKLDSNFNTPITIGNTSVLLGNTVTTLNNLTLANVTITSGTSNIANVNVTNIAVTNLTATLANVTTLNVASASITSANIGNLSLTNALSVANGGTGRVTLPANNVLVGNGTGGIATVAPGNVGNVLTSIGGAWVSNAVVSNAAAGSNTQVQYNNSGALGASANLVFDGTNLGIGVTSPTYKLDVTTAGTLGARITTAEYGQFALSDGTRAIYLQNYTGVGSIGTSTNVALTFAPNGTERMRLDSSGNLGIGTSSPSEKLDVSQGNIYVLRTGGAKLRLLDQNNEVSIESLPVGVASEMVFKNNLVERMRLDSSGNLGIGTSSPGAKLDVNGNALVNGLSLGKGISSGANNTVFGLNAGNAQTTGIANTLVGMNAGISLTSGTQNTFFGRSAGTGVTTQNNNTCIGYNTGIGPIGAGNTAIGYRALVDTTSTTATFNTSVGYQALATLNTYTNCSGLGADAAVTGDNQIQLGDSATTTYVYGTVQNRSDLRDKADVRDTQLGLAFVNALRPVDYKLDMRDDYKPAIPDDVENAEAMAAWREASKIENLTHDGSKKRLRYHHGLIAQEVKAVLDAQGIDFGGYQDHKIKGGDDVLSIGYDELIAPLIKSIQELTARIAQLEAK